MKNIQPFFLVFLFAVIAGPFTGFSQNVSSSELYYEVNRVYPYISVDHEKLNAAFTLSDLNGHYKPSWVKEYVSVEISTIYQGKNRKATSTNEVLNEEQKNIMKMADAGTTISVLVRYLPNNNLVDNDIKELDFTFTVAPENEAVYIGGQQAMRQYLKENAIASISADRFTGYDLAAVKFTVNEEGEIGNVHLFETSKGEEIDQLLLKAVSNMPCWKPAQYADGTKVKQEFVLTVGNMDNCIVHLLNIRRELN